jgi:predicted RNA-binding protein YlxR (DUF448 family)
VACRTARDKRDLLRIVRAPDGAVGLDASGRSNGRGAYVCRDEACVANAVDRRLLDRALETQLPAGLRAELMAEAAISPMIGGSIGQE